MTNRDLNRLEPREFLSCDLSTFKTGSKCPSLLSCLIKPFSNHEFNGFLFYFFWMLNNFSSKNIFNQSWKSNHKFFNTVLQIKNGKFMEPAQDVIRSRLDKKITSVEENDDSLQDCLY